MLKEPRICVYKTQSQQITLCQFPAREIFILLLEKITCCSILTNPTVFQTLLLLSLIILSLIMNSKRIEETRNRSTERSPTGAPTAPRAPRIPSVVVQIPCAAARVQSWTPNSQGDMKKTEKTEKEKEEKEKMEKKEKKENKEKKPAATITLSDLKRAGTSMGAQNDFPQCNGSSMGAQNTVLRPDDLTQLEGAIFDSTNV